MRFQFGTAMRFHFGSTMHWLNKCQFSNVPQGVLKLQGSILVFLWPKWGIFLKLKGNNISDPPPGAAPLFYQLAVSVS